MILDSLEFKNKDVKIILESRADEDYEFIDDTGFMIYKIKNYKTNDNDIINKKYFDTNSQHIDLSNR